MDKYNPYMQAAMMAAKTEDAKWKNLSGTWENTEEGVEHIFEDIYGNMYGKGMQGMSGGGGGNYATGVRGQETRPGGSGNFIETVDFNSYL